MSRSSVAVLAVLASCYAPKSQPSLRPPTLDSAKPTAAELTSSTSFDERSAIAYAMQHSPLLTERADVERVADAKIGAARQLSNPELRIGQESETGLLGTSSKNSIGLRLHLDAPWTLSARVSRARAERDAERAKTASTAGELTTTIKELYVDIAFEEALQAMLERQLVVLRERNRVLAARMEHATATRLENLLADHDLADLEDAKADVDLDLLRSRAKLARVIGIPAGQEFHPVADQVQLRSVATDVDVDTLMQRALVANPDMAEQAALANAAGAQVYEEKTKRLPALDWLQVERATSTEVEWSVGASITVPLFSLNSGEIATAKAQQQQHVHERARIADKLRHEIQSAVDVVRATGKRAREMTARLGPLNEQIDALLEQERASATADPIKLLLLEERHVRAQRDLLDASYAHRRALIDLDKLTRGMQ